MFFWFWLVACVSFVAGMILSGFFNTPDDDELEADRAYQRYLKALGKRAVKR